MLNIGLIDLDTSHARSFTEKLNSTGEARVLGVFDGGQVRTDEQVETFCRQMECKRYDSVQSLVQDVDGVMVLSADWNVHLDRAAPALEAGVPVYIDKPLAGRTADLDRFADLATRTGTPIFAGSGWRFNSVIDRARETFKDATIERVHTAIGNGFYYYGIHSVGLLLGLLGPGIESVELLADGEQAAVVAFEHRRGASGRMLMKGSTFFRGVAFEADGENQCVHFTAHDIHVGICDQFLDMLRHKRSPMTPDELTEACRVMLAATQSARDGGPVRVDQLDPAVEQPSDDFMAAYIHKSRPQTLVGAGA